MARDGTRIATLDLGQETTPTILTFSDLTLLLAIAATVRRLCTNRRAITVLSSL